jgi:hypothetical protein
MVNVSARDSRPRGAPDGPRHAAEGSREWRINSVLSMLVLQNVTPTPKRTSFTWYSRPAFKADATPVAMIFL